ncbi:MAG: hypothetical protein V4754_16940 [Pseudomonadota bacterium]
MNTPEPRSEQHSDQGRNSAMDKTDAYHPDSDPYANQGGGKSGSGNQGSGNPANDPAARREAGKTESVRARDQDQVAHVHPAGAADSGSGAHLGHEQGSKGSGNPPRSEAGKRADDRPGHDAPKGE